MASPRTPSSSGIRDPGRMDWLEITTASALVAGNVLTCLIRLPQGVASFCRNRSATRISALSGAYLLDNPEIPLQVRFHRILSRRRLPLAPEPHGSRWIGI